MDTQQQQQQPQPQPASQLKTNKSLQDLTKCLSEFFKRDLISIPLIRKLPHTQLNQRCGTKSATLEFDTAAFPNIEYIAGTRLSIYPANPADQVNALLRHLLDDVGSPAAVANSGSVIQARQSPASANNSSNITNNNNNYNNYNTNNNNNNVSNKKIKLNDQQSNNLQCLQQFGRDALRLALTYFYDIMMAPSRELLTLIASHCGNKTHKAKLASLAKSDDSWEKWICQDLRTLKSTFDEFNSCSPISAKSFLAELSLQQPRQYSISSIKSSKRFRAEIIVFQHKFSTKQVASAILNSKERDLVQQKDNQTVNVAGRAPRSPSVHVNHHESPANQRAANSVRSLRGSSFYNSSPISTQRVKRVPSYSGPLMSLYASSSIASSSSSKSKESAASSTSRASSSQASSKARSILSLHASANADIVSASQTGERRFEGLCSNYLLNLNVGDQIVCEFVENPRFTLKGNRERPIMMIAQDVGVVAFRPFWQQRSLEHDRAQVFYSLFRDLAPKKFGDMQLVCLTGHNCKVEDLFKREINSVLTGKIISSAAYLHRKYLISMLDSAAAAAGAGPNSNTSAPSKSPNEGPIRTPTGQYKIKIETKELQDLGDRIAKLLIDSNGCLYTCCDPQLTQAIEMLAIESIARNTAYGLTRDQIMAKLMPKWKGYSDTNLASKQFLFTIENPFEKAQIVQEIYDFAL